jgi:hypothetical protein
MLSPQTNPIETRVTHQQTERQTRLLRHDRSAQKFSAGTTGSAFELSWRAELDSVDVLTLQPMTLLDWLSRLQSVTYTETYAFPGFNTVALSLKEKFVYMKCIVHELDVCLLLHF